MREDLLYHGVAARPGKANAAPCFGDSCDLFRSRISASVQRGGETWGRRDEPGRIKEAGRCFHTSSVPPVTTPTLHPQPNLEGRSQPHWGFAFPKEPRCFSPGAQSSLHSTALPLTSAQKANQMYVGMFDQLHFMPRYVLATHPAKLSATAAHFPWGVLFHL